MNMTQHIIMNIKDTSFMFMTVVIVSCGSWNADFVMQTFQKRNDTC